MHKLLSFLLLMGTTLTATGETLLSPTSLLLAKSRLVYEAGPVQGEYRLILSSIKKVNGRWRSEDEKTLTGTIHRRTYELRDLLTFAEAENLLQAQLDRVEPKQRLFRCEGLDCGSSNAWANQVFQVNLLYGIDSSQLYSAWALAGSAGSQTYAALYLVQRGNRRIYLQEDVVVTPEGEDLALLLQPAGLKRALEERGFLVVPELHIEQGQLVLSEASARLLADFLKAYPDLSVLLVGHDYQEGTVDEQIARSKRHSQTVAAALKKLGVDERRWKVQGVGSLAPAGRQGQARVEVVPAP